MNLRDFFRDGPPEYFEIDERYTELYLELETIRAEEQFIKEIEEQERKKHAVLVR